MEEHALDCRALPATYFGAVWPGAGFTPTAGMPVTAWIDGRLCGRSVTQAVGGQIMVAIHVLAEGRGAAAGCGTLGRQVHFMVGSTAMTPTVIWDNDHTSEIALLPQLGSYESRWLPLVLRR